MQCYDCGETGREAIGVCFGCGRAVCREHGQLRRWPLLERVAQGMGYQYRPSGRQRTVLLCGECQGLSADELFRWETCNLLDCCTNLCYIIADT